MLIAAAPVLDALKQRAALPDSDVLGFTDTDVLRALEAITARKPRLVALERLFAATPRGTALINRIKSDPALTETELRVLAHDSDYNRVLPRTAGGAPGPLRADRDAGDAPVAANVVAAGLPKPEPASTAATLEPLAEPSGSAANAPALLDPTGTRVAPRVKMAHQVDILVDGNPATLLDLSTSGAQVISPTILRPNQRVRVALTDDTRVLRFNASIAWAAFEIPRSGPQYRAGIEFVDADGAAIDAFCTKHS